MAARWAKSGWSSRRRAPPAAGTPTPSRVVNPTTNDLHLSWDVPYEPGVLRAVGKRRDGTVACEAEVRTAGPPAAIRLSVDRDTITTGPGDVAHVTFEIVDSAGTVVPTADNLVSFTVTGGNILVVDNAESAGPRPLPLRPPARVQRPRAGDSARASSPGCSA